MQSVTCPQCGGPTRIQPDNPWRPFCSERCKLLDLGEWFDETRAIPAQEPGDWDEAGEPEPH